METSTGQPSDSLTAREIRTLLLASLGGALEFYDFVIFVFFTSVLGKLFFSPGMSDWLRQMQTFGIFAAGYLARPLGGIVMAHFGDTRGRKRMFTLSVLLMAIPTLLIGFLPTWRTIGAAAPLLLLTMRLIQGVAIGGEAPGGWVFVAEHARRGRTGLAVGLLTGGLTGGIFLGSVAATVFDFAFTQDEIAAWAWRLPFVIGGLFGFIAMFLRRWLDETPVFRELRQRAAISRELPLRIVLREHGRAVRASVISTWMLSAIIVVAILMTPTLLQTLFHIAPRQAQLSNLAATFALCVSTVITGIATDRFGIRRVATLVLLLMIAASWGLYWAAGNMTSALLPLYVAAGLGSGAVALTPIVMVRAFPASVRYSGVSFSYNVAYAIFGGLTPLLVSWLIHFERLAPAYYIAAVSALGLAATLMAPTYEEPEGTSVFLSTGYPDGRIHDPINSSMVCSGRESADCRAAVSATNNRGSAKAR